MIYVHVIFNIHSANTDKLLQTQEHLIKFQDEEDLNQFSFNQVKKLEKNHLQYPGKREAIRRFLNSYFNPG